MSVYWGSKFYAATYPNAVATTSSGSNLFGLDGDTIRIDTSRTITNSTDAGYVGEICWDNTYIYVCVATNTWKRAAMLTW